MDIERLAKQAAVAIESTTYALQRMHGIEVAEGFFNIYNTVSGQSRVVLYHPESDLVFKESYYRYDESASNQYLCEIEMDGVTYRVRYPKFFYVNVGSDTIEVQEYVRGVPDTCIEDLPENHGMVDCWCHHALLLAQVTGECDVHTGNWRFVGNEIVIFDR